MKKLNSLKNLFLLLLVLLNTGGILNVSAQNGWELMKPMDLARGGAGSCGDDSLIYVFGGCNSEVDILSSAQAYNINTNEWSDLAPMPMGLYEPNVEIINDAVYVAGGWYKLANGNWVTSDSTFAYDPAGDSWSVRANCPKATGTNSSCVLNDTLYILGGTEFPGSTDVKKAWYYVPEEDSWGEIPDMIYQHGEYGSACVRDSIIYAIGGVNATTAIMYPVQAEKYFNGTWEKIADIPVPVANHVTVIHDNNILAFGGDSGKFTPSKSYATNLVQEYDPITDSWSRMQGMPFKRSNMMGEKVGNYFYLMGGYNHSRDFNSPLDEVWRFNLDSLIVQHVEIPDTAFLHALIDEGVDSNGDGVISFTEAEGVEDFRIHPNIFGENRISDMTGIEAFVNLKYLGIFNTQITTLDVSKCINLEELNCLFNNHLTSLDVSGCAVLWYLYCYANQLTSLDVSNNKGLITLWCGGNKLSDLDVSGCTHLRCLDCSNNQLTSLDLSSNSLILNGGDCSPYSLDLSYMPTLQQVCVWELPFPNEKKAHLVNVTGSPNVNFTTECTIGIEEANLSDLSIYPNPTNSLLTIETEHPDRYSIEITSLNGQQILKGEVGGISHQIDLSSFQKGVYFITIRSKDFVATRKIIKL